MLDRTAILKEAQKYLAKGAVDKAISELERLVTESPDGSTYNMIGDIYLRKGTQKSAIEYYLKAAVFFRHEGFSQKAQALYKKVLNINSADTDALMAFGEICEEKGMLAEAIKYYLVVADLLAKEGNKDKLLNTYAKILSLSPANIPLRVKVSDIYLREGLKPEAAREFVLLARIYDEKGDNQKAREFFQRALGVQPLNKDAALGLSHLYEKAGELQKAFEQMKDATVLFPEDTDILFRCADIALISDNPDLCRKCLQKIIEKEPKNLKACRMLSELYLKIGDIEGAWAQYLPILDEVLIDQEFDDALSFLTTFKTIDPLETGRRLVSLYKQLSEDDQVVTELMALGDVYFDKGLKDEALTCYAEAEQINPSHPEVRKKHAPPEAEPTVPELTFPETDISEPAFDLDSSLIPETDISEPAFNLDSSLIPETDISEPAFNLDSSLIPEINISDESLELAGDSKTGETFSPAPSESASTRSFSPAEEKTEQPGGFEKTLHETLTEADIFSRYGLISEAQRLLEGLKLRFPDNIDLHLRLKSLYADTLNREAAVSECIILSELYKRGGDEPNAEQELRDAFEISPEDPRLAEHGLKEPIPFGNQASFPASSIALDEALSTDELNIENYEEDIAEADFYARQGLAAEAFKILEGLQKLFPENKNINERLKSLGQTANGIETGELADSIDMRDAFGARETIEAQGKLELQELLGADDDLEVTGNIELQELLGADDDLKMTGNIELQEEIELSEKYDLVDVDRDIGKAEPAQEELPPVQKTVPTTAVPPEDMEFETFAFTDHDLQDAQEMPEPALDNDVLEIFQEFKKGLDKELGDEDSETHYNLGIAYKEMGLIEDAIKEFQTSRSDPERFIQSSTMLGVCYMEKGLYSLAIEVLNKAVVGMKEKDDSYWALIYELAEAYEKNLNLQEALELYTGVYGWSAKFRDVSGKMSRLRAKAPLSTDNKLKTAQETPKEKPKERKDRVSYL